MNLGDLAAFVGGKIGMSDAATLTKLKGFALERYKQLYAGALWKDALSIYTAAVAIDQTTVILPSHVAQFIAAKADRERLVPIDHAFLFSSYPELWDSTGTPTHCSELAAIAVKTLPSAEVVKVKSSSAADVAPAKVTLHGEDANSDPIQEQIVLNGVALVASVNSYTLIYGFSKAATTGTITLRNAADNVTLQTLLPGDTQRLHRRIRLHAIPKVALTLLVLAKRHPATFVNDTDATALPALCDQALQAYVHGDALEWQRQYGKAQGKFAEAIALEKSAKATETYQAAQTQRFTPGDAMAEGCSPNDFV